jgi:hypothetical protein
MNELSEGSGLPSETNLTAGHLETLLTNLTTLTCIQDVAESSTPCFIKKKEPCTLIVLPPSTDKQDSGTDIKSLQQNIQNYQDSCAIDTIDVLICPLLHEHPWGKPIFGSAIKANRNQWVILMLDFQGQGPEKKCAATLIDPTGQLRGNRYTGFEFIHSHFSAVFRTITLENTISKIYLNKQDPGGQDWYEANTSASGHWVIHGIKLLVEGTSLTELPNTMSGLTIEEVIAANQALYQQSPEPISKTISLVRSDSDPSESSNHSEHSDDSEVFTAIPDTVRPIICLTHEEFLTSGAIRTSQFRVISNSEGINNQTEQTPSASMHLHWYDLLFKCGLAALVVGTLGLLSLAAGILPVVLTGLIVAGGFGLFVGTVGRCITPSTPSISIDSTPRSLAQQT